MTTWAVAQTAAYALLAPLFVGLLRRLKARFQRRRGPDPIQPYRDLVKLLRKRPSVPESASRVFLLAPAVVFTCFLLLGFTLPIFTVTAAPEIDVVLVIALLGLAKLATALAAFDAGAPFGPMSSGRQLFIHVFAEPALLVLAYVLALTRNTTDLPAALLTTHPPGNPMLSQSAIPLALAALGCVLMAESGRLPFDNPATHLELTMIELGSHLEYSGRALALMEWANAMKLTFALSLLARLAFPWGMPAGDSPLPALRALSIYLVEVGALLAGLAWWEVTRGKIRLKAIVTPLVLAIGVLLFTAVLIVVALVVTPASAPLSR